MQLASLPLLPPPLPQRSAPLGTEFTASGNRKTLFSPKRFSYYIAGTRHPISTSVSAGSWELDLGEFRAHPWNCVVSHVKVRTPRGDVLKILLVRGHRVATPGLRPCPLQRKPLTNHLLLSMHEYQATGHSHVGHCLSPARPVPGTSPSFASFGFSLERLIYP